MLREAWYEKPWVWLTGLVLIFALGIWHEYTHPCELVRPCINYATICIKGECDTTCTQRGPLQERDPQRCAEEKVQW